MNRGYIVALGYFFAFCAHSKQLYFDKVEYDKTYHFQYEWLDHSDQPQSLQFSLNKAALFNKFRHFGIYKPALAQQEITHQVVKYFHKNPVKNVQVKYDKTSQLIQIKAADLQRIQQVQAKIKTLNNEYTQAYLHKKHYIAFTSPNQTPLIKPDHVKFASLSATDLKPIKPLLLEKVSIKNIRKATNYVLAFVQSIPYSALTSRENSSGAGFNPPLKLIWENQGDCDSKVTLTAAILRTLMPRIKMVLVFIDNHALIGIDATPQGDDLTIMVNGTNYVLGEPTGPAMLTLGHLDEASELAIAQGHYTAEEFH